MTAQTLTLTDFLLARIAEDEASAKDCLAYPEAMRTYDREVQDSYRQGWRSERASDLISRWHPARVLAECEAKRRIVDVHHPLDNDPEPFCWNCDEETWPCRTMAALALPYADHPDYNPDWRP